jgi:hypothetical protein
MTDVYAEIAAQLRHMADDLDGLAGVGLPAPYFSIDIHPHGESDEQIVATVDAVATALLGTPGETYPVSGGFHHGHRGRRGPIWIGVYERVSDPAERERAAELARLRTEVAVYRSQVKPAGPLRPVVVLEDEIQRYLSPAGGGGR